jgi:hypothetical protein
MLSSMLIMISLGFMAFLSRRWLVLTEEMQADMRHRRMRQHIDWQAPDAGRPRSRKLAR